MDLNRKTSTQSINHLRTLDLNDLLSLHINPSFAFSKDLVDMSRMKNLHGKLPDSEYIVTQDDARTTRSGLVYTSSKIRPNKCILKSMHSIDDVDNFYETKTQVKTHEKTDNKTIRQSPNLRQCKHKFHISLWNLCGIFPGYIYEGDGSGY